MGKELDQTKMNVKRNGFDLKVNVHTVKPKRKGMYEPHSSISVATVQTAHILTSAENTERSTLQPDTDLKVAIIGIKNQQNVLPRKPEQSPVAPQIKQYTSIPVATNFRKPKPLKITHQNNPFRSKQTHTS